MKIGIITFHRAENYGSVLQAYALNAYIRYVQPDAEVEEIDYESDAQHDLYRILEKPKSLMSVARLFHSIVYYRALKRKKEKFTDFINHYIPLSKIHGNITEEVMKEYAAQYDIIICGSDQIWNIHCADSNDFYFLSFASAHTKKVAYAPSLGLDYFSSDEKRIMAKRIGHFDFLSARESSGAAIISSITGKNVTTVCDPVLLFSVKDWIKLSHSIKSIEQPYILCYFIGNISGMRQFAKKVKHDTGISKVIIIMKNLRDIGAGYSTRYDTGPIEFLNLIENASYVITDSFHATCFSLLFHTKFWVFVEPDSTTKPNSRIVNILSIAKCYDRMLTVANMNDIDLEANIDFDIADMNISEYSSSSKYFLTDILRSI